MDRDTREARAASFGSVAEAYERARPGYPDDVARWLAGDPPRDVIDLAAGTGKLTRQLVALGHRVVAVEPAEDMLAQLRASLPGARGLVGSAEAIPLGDASADAVVVAQAFHWFDHAAALAEIARVLRPGGVLGLVWNMRDDREPWVARLSEVIGSEHMDDLQVEQVLAAGGLFGPVATFVGAHEQRLDRHGLRDLVLSRSLCAVRPRAERAEILAAVDAVYDGAAGPEGLLLPYVTHAYRAERL